MKQRAILLKKLKNLVIGNDFKYGPDLCFRVLYGLPAELQIELSIFMIKRYLPYFKKKWPDYNWPFEILDNVENWVKVNKREVPYGSEAIEEDDINFISCFDAILLAVYCKTNQVTVTQSCVFVIDSIIEAHRCSDLALDRLKFEQKKETTNSIYQLITKREWEALIEWLEDKNISQYPDANAEEVENVLNEWIDNHMVLIVPKCVLDELRVNRDILK